jgi:hypothetical protein
MSFTDFLDHVVLWESTRELNNFPILKGFLNSSWSCFSFLGIPENSSSRISLLLLLLFLSIWILVWLVGLFFIAFIYSLYLVF